MTKLKLHDESYFKLNRELMTINVAEKQYQIDYHIDVDMDTYQPNKSIFLDAEEVAEYYRENDLKHREKGLREYSLGSKFMEVYEEDGFFFDEYGLNCCYYLLIDVGRKDEPDWLIYWCKHCYRRMAPGIRLKDVFPSFVRAYLAWMGRYKIEISTYTYF